MLDSVNIYEHICVIEPSINGGVCQSFQVWATATNMLSIFCQKIIKDSNLYLKIHTTAFLASLKLMFKSQIKLFTNYKNYESLPVDSYATIYWTSPDGFFIPATTFTEYPLVINPLMYSCTSCFKS